MFGSQLLWAPQRVMASCGKWLAKKKDREGEEWVMPKRNWGMGKVTESGAG